MNAMSKPGEPSRRPRRTAAIPAVISAALFGLIILAVMLWPVSRALGANAGSGAGDQAVQAQSVEQHGQESANGAGTPAQPQDCGLLWRVVPSVNGGTYNNGMESVKVISANDIWAVGEYSEMVNGAQVFHGLAEHWNGSAWSLVSVPQSGTNSSLHGVSGVSSSDLWAVGYYVPTDGAHGRTLTLHWDGSSWSQVSSPNIGTLDNTVTSVWAVAPDAVWAVGWSINANGSTTSTLVLFWDGTSWSSLPSASPGYYNSLFSVTATTADDMWAVGEVGAGDGSPSRNITIHCTRSACSLVSSPNGGVGDNRLTDVAALSPNEVYAVGYSEVMTTPRTLVPLTLRWDGVGWSALPTPPLPPDLPQVGFQSITAISSNDIWAVGFAYSPSPAQQQTYGAHWNGTAWTAFSPPNLSIANSFLGSDAVGSNDIWAVGFTSNSNNISQTLAERYSDPCITPSPTVAANRYSHPFPTAYLRGLPYPVQRCASELGFLYLCTVPCLP